MTSRVDPKVACTVLDNAAARHYGSYVGAADTARLIRSALKLAFPGFKFSVTSDSYSGGSSVRVKWTDGPSEAHVDDALSGFAGHGFDGMIDMAFSHDCYMTRAGTVGYAGTNGTVGSHGTVSAVHNDVPDGATVVRFNPYIFTDRALTGSLPDFGDYWAWKAINDSDRPAAPVGR
jgi:hypothetical protein